MTAQDVLKVAAAEIGYCEKKSNSQLDDKTANAGSNNYTKYARDLYKAGYWNGNKNGYDWCTTFCAWCFWMAAGKNKDKAIEVQPYGSLGASCKYQTGYYKKVNRFFSNPVVGDQAFFTRGHTGLVEAFDGKKLTLIEGNSNNKVERRTYSFPNEIFSGFGRPFYTAASVPKEEPKPVETFLQYKGKVTSTNGLNVRTGNSTSYKKLGALKYNTVVTILGEKAGWGRINYNGKDGWCCLNWIKKV